MVAEVAKPRRALVFFFGDGEKITGTRIRDRLIARDYAIIPEPIIEGRAERAATAVIAGPGPVREPVESVRSACGWCHRLIFWSVEGEAHSWGRCVNPVAAARRKAEHEAKR